LSWVAKAKGGQNPRAVAVSVLTRVLQEGQSLSTLLPHSFQGLPPERRALAQELCYGTLRWAPRLEALLKLLLAKPLKAKDSDVKSLLLLGLYQLGYMDIPPHAAVSETVAVTALLNKGWAKGLVNAVLRRFQRERDDLESALAKDEVATSAHPAWLLALLKQAWPKQWSAIVEANNHRPPMTLRVNRRHHDREAYQAILEKEGLAAETSPHAPDALTLTQPVNVEQLPGFARGEVSVQDAAAQLAAVLVAPEAGMRVLDACAAPGGKTGHLLEICSDIELIALDIEKNRLLRVEQNLTRLGLHAQLVAADAATPASWWDGKPFDRILLDAPCSASGVIRRHPDIKLLRQASDIEQLVKLQATILEALWSLLSPGGVLVYATCSVLPQENGGQLANFLANHEDAKERPLDTRWGQATTVGRQILPDQDGMDGFFYACIEKSGGC
jgi:16S rRNA (cytosine967-C5)-methyltransferase